LAEEDVTKITLEPCWSLKHQRAVKKVKHYEDWKAFTGKLRTFLGVRRAPMDVIRSGGCFMRRWVVEDMFPVGSSVMLSGETGVGKSWIVLDMVRAILTGGRWLGVYECDQGPVQYASGGDDTYDNVLARLIGLEFGSGGDPRAFMDTYGDILTVASHSVTAGRVFPLSDGVYREKLLENVAKYPQEVRPTAWVFDPIGALVADMNNDQVREIVVWSKTLAQISGGISLFVNHLKFKNVEGLSPASKTRGNEFWRNLADHTLEVEKDSEDDNWVHLTWSKSKNVHSPGGNKPAFSIQRSVAPLNPQDNDTLLESFDLDPSEFPPQTAYKAVLWHRTYEEKAPQESRGSSDLPIVEPTEAPQRPLQDSTRESTPQDEGPSELAQMALEVIYRGYPPGLVRFRVQQTLQSLPGVSPRLGPRPIKAALRELMELGLIQQLPGKRSNAPYFAPKPLPKGEKP
jgi:hypothetical protein